MPNQSHFVIHKPFGFLSQFISNQSKRKKRMLGELFDFPEGTMSVGRLDADSEGLLLLTTDGKMSDYINSKKIEKEYYVQVDGLIDEEAISTMKNGVEISIHGKKYQTKPCNAQKLPAPPNFPMRTKKIRDERHGPTSWATITISEGKFRQVRKMTDAVGFPTLRLIRVRIGSIMLDDIKAGDVMEVESFNV